MIICVYILTALFAISTVAILKKKRYKVMPLISYIIIFAFIGFTCISLFTILLPYGEIFVYPLVAIVGGLLFIFVGINDIYALTRCKEKIVGVYCGYNTYYGGHGVSTQAPVFSYTYKEKNYREQATYNVSYKKMNYEMLNGNTYDIYIDPKHPSVFILSKKMKPSTIIVIILGLFFLFFGIVLFSMLFPTFLYVSR